MSWSVDGLKAALCFGSANIHDTLLARFIVR
jgi:hypothetical protein